MKPKTSRSSFPFYLLTCAIVLTVSFFTVFIFYGSKYYQNIGQNQIRKAHIERLKGDIIYYDEVLTMSARMAAFTGNTVWYNRYVQEEKKLDRTIKEMRALLPESYQSHSILVTDAANQHLVAMEKKAFARVHKKQLIAAQKILLGKEYHHQKKLYHQGIEHINALLHTTNLQQLNRIKTRLLYVGVILCVLVIVIIFTWVKTYIAVREWKKMLHISTLSLNESNKKLATTIQQLKHSNKELEQFNYVVSHDIKGPLRNIHSFSQLLTAEYSRQIDQQGQQYLLMIQQSVLFIQSLVEALLALGKVTSQSNIMTQVPCDKVIETVMVNMKQELRKTEATISLQPLPVVYGNAMQLSQLFQNLLHNAIKYRQPRQKPVISIEAQEEYPHIWHFKITDNGVGFETQHHDMIFEPFKREKTQQETEGLGIGLAICKKIVENHGGCIWADSKKNNGSTFHFTLQSQEKIGACK